MFYRIALAVLSPLIVCAQVSTDQRITDLERAVHAQPKNPRAQLTLALAYLQKVRESADYSYLDLASKTVAGVLGDDSANNEAVRIRNEIGLQKHEFRDVAASAEDLSRIVPSDAGNWADLGDALMELGEYEKAGKAYERMLGIRPGLESYNRLAYHRFVTGDPDAAIRLMQMAIQAGGPAPENVAWCYAELGDIYWKTGKVTEAAEAYHAATRLFPALHRAHAGLARIYAAEGKRTQAIESYKRAQAAVPLVEYSAALEKLYTAEGKVAEARKQRNLIDVMDRLASARGEKANRTLAFIYIDEGRNLGRAVELTEAELENRGDVYSYDALAWVYYKQKRLDEAQKMAARALHLNTPEPAFYYHAGLIASAAGDQENARRLLSHALELNPKFDREQAADALKRLSPSTGN